MTTASKSLRDRLSPVVRNLPKSGIRDFFEIVATRDDVISLGIGEPDFVTPWHIRERAISAIERGATHYTSNLGLAELRRSICSYIKQSYPGLNYNWRTEVMVTVGVSEALDGVMRAIIEPGDEIIYHEPCFVSYAATIRLAHAVPVAVETSAQEDFKLTVEALESKVTERTKALLINFPCNPTGAALTLNEDYTVAYANNNGVGTGTATVTGINAYAGCVQEKTFRIVEAVAAGPCTVEDWSKAPFHSNAKSNTIPPISRIRLTPRANLVLMLVRWR